MLFSTRQQCGGQQRPLEAAAGTAPRDENNRTRGVMDENVPTHVTRVIITTTM